MHMLCNLAFWDRFLRFFIGIILGAWAVAGGPTWGFVGFYFIVTAAWGFCPLYTLMRFRTLRINQSPEEDSDE